MTTSHPMPAEWVTPKLENNSTKEVLALLWRFRTQSQATQPGVPTERQGIWPWRPGGFDCKTSTGLGETGTPVLAGTHKTLHAPRLRGKGQRLHRRLSQNCLLVLEGLLWWRGSAGAHRRDAGMAAAVWEGPLWSKPSWRSPLTPESL